MRKSKDIGAESSREGRVSSPRHPTLAPRVLHRIVKRIVTEARYVKHLSLTQFTYDEGARMEEAIAR